MNFNDEKDEQNPSYIPLDLTFSFIYRIFETKSKYFENFFSSNFFSLEFQHIDGFVDVFEIENTILFLAYLKKSYNK